MDAVVPWETGALGGSLATRHSQEAHLPCKQRAAFGSKLASHTYLFVWPQAEQEHA